MICEDNLYSFCEELIRVNFDQGPLINEAAVEKVGSFIPVNLFML